MVCLRIIFFFPLLFIILFNFIGIHVRPIGAVDYPHNRRLQLRPIWLQLLLRNDGIEFILRYSNGPRVFICICVGALASLWNQ